MVQRAHGDVVRSDAGYCYFSLAERKNQQTRTQQHETSRGQGKESVGDNIVVAHDTPTTQMLVRIY